MAVETRDITQRLAGMNIHYFRHSLRRFLDDVVVLGFSSVELWAGMPHLALDDAKDDEVRAVARLLAERELRLSCLTPEQCLYPINLAAEHEATAHRSLAYFEKALELCETLRCEQLLVTAGWGYADMPADAPWSRARDQLGRLAESATKRGITLLLEPLSRKESNLITTSAELAQMMEEIGSPSLAAILDLNAMAAADETPDDYLRRFGRQLRHVHVCDGTPEGHLAWGDGNLPLSDYIRTLLSSGYQGDFSFEFVSQSYWLEPREPLASSRAFLLHAAQGNHA